MRTYDRKRPECEMIDGVQDLCRLCLNKPEGGFPIFAHESNDICSALSTRIMLCVGLEMIREENLPNMICSSCNTELEKCYKFRKMCERAYQRLKQHIQYVKMKEYNQNYVFMKTTDEKEAINNESIKKIKENNLQPDKSNIDGVEYFYSDKSNLVLVINESDIEVDNSQINVETSHNQNIIEIANESSNQFVNTIEEVVSKEDIEVPGISSNELESQCAGDKPPQVSKPNMDISSFIATQLIENDVLTLQNDRVGLSDDMNTILELLTEDGYMVTMHVQEDDDIKEEESTHSMMYVVRELDSKSEETIPILKPRKRKVTHNGAKPKNNTLHTCNQCGKSFSKGSVLRRHVRAHSALRPHACRHCGRAFTQKEVMRRHELVHAEQRPFPCTQCDKSFTQRGALVAHARSHCSPAERALALRRCPLCTKIFLYASGLSRHMKTHSGRVYVCGECSRQFKDKSSLRRHMKATNHASQDDKLIVARQGPS